MWRNCPSLQLSRGNEKLRICFTTLFCKCFKHYKDYAGFSFFFFEIIMASSIVKVMVVCCVRRHIE